MEILALSNVITLVEIAAPAIDTFRAEAFDPFGNCLVVAEWTNSHPALERQPTCAASAGS